ncbi:MAG: c-type cytochrome domain-containing protein, partial [Planctomycetota bacterium]
MGSSVGVAQSLDEDGNLVQFDRDVAPILRQHCLECHGSDDAKADFSLNDGEQIMDYLEVGDASLSDLYTEYLTTEDEDMMMPPPSHGGPLSPSELALFKIWIDEGASWPEDMTLEGSAEEPVAQPAAQP